jgi:alcohol dehydrogenase
MRAVTFHEHGPLTNLNVEDMSPPEMGPGECLLRVKAVSLNGFDPMVLEGIPTLRTPLPMVPGADIAAEIVDCGPEVDKTRWSIGKRVAVTPNQDTGMMGETLRGGMCEFISVEPRWLIDIPDGVSNEEAACLPTAYATAYRMLHSRGQVQKDEKLLILGASGGVGTCCVELAKRAGCEIVACTSSGEKAEKLKSIGADHVINTSRDDFVKWVIDHFGKPRTRGEGGGVDVCVNYIGGDTWAQCLRAVRRGGRILTCGATAGYDPKTDLRYIWSFEHTIIGSNGWKREDHVELLDMIAAGTFKPIIDSVRPIDAVRESMSDLIERRVFGKAVLVP